MSCQNQYNCHTGVNCALEKEVNSAFADSPFGYDNDPQSICLQVHELNGPTEDLEFLRVGFYNLCVSYNSIVAERMSWNRSDSTPYIMLPVWPPNDETTDVGNLLEDLKKNHVALQKKHKAILIERKRIRQQNKFYIDKLMDSYPFN